MLLAVHSHGSQVLLSYSAASLVPLVHVSPLLVGPKLPVILWEPIPDGTLHLPLLCMESAVRCMTPLVVVLLLMTSLLLLPGHQ